MTFKPLPCPPAASLLVSFAMALALAACDDGSTAPDDAVDDEATVLCDRVDAGFAVVEGTDVVSELGFSADDVLAHAVVGPRDSELHWWRPEGGSLDRDNSVLTISVRYAGGQVRVVEPTPEPRRFTLDARCDDRRLEVDVEITLTSQDGKVDVSAPGVLSATDARWATLRAEVDAASVEGSGAAGLPGQGLEVVDAVVVRATFVDGFSSGRIGTDYVFEQDGQVVAAAGGGHHFTWPDAFGCNDDADEVSVPLDAGIVAFSANDVLARVADRTAPLTWDDGTSTQLTMSASTARSIACYTPASSEGPETLGLHADIEMKTEDGRLDTRLGIAVEVDTQVDGSFGTIYAVDYGVGASGEDFEDTYGIHGFSPSEYDYATVKLSATFEADATDGDFEVIGRNPTTCPGPDSCPFEETSLGGGSWQAP